MEIKVLGPGCSRCKSTFQVIEKVIKENNLDVKLTKVDDVMEMMKYNILSTPAVVVDEVVKMKGQVPSESDVKKLLGI
jgi:small redox-active disulfide protein 2